MNRLVFTSSEGKKESLTDKKEIELYTKLGTLEYLIAEIQEKATRSSPLSSPLRLEFTDRLRKCIYSLQKLC